MLLLSISKSRSNITQEKSLKLSKMSRVGLLVWWFLRRSVEKALKFNNTKKNKLHGYMKLITGARGGPLPSGTRLITLLPPKNKFEWNGKEKQCPFLRATVSYHPRNQYPPWHSKIREFSHFFAPLCLKQDKYERQAQSGLFLLLEHTSSNSK